LIGLFGIKFELSQVTVVIFVNGLNLEFCVPGKTISKLGRSSAALYATELIFDTGRATAVQLERSM
jgi:hypothetical protein